jgi:hypothetical protein
LQHQLHVILYFFRDCDRSSSPVKAKRLVYDIKGIKSLLLAVGGGKTLTIYYVAAPVRENFVGCVMSFWNNDVKNTEGLPPLLAEVMTLKRQHP